jgi:hypothetical protein
MWLRDEVRGRAGVWFREIVETEPLAGLEPWIVTEGGTDGSQR